MSAEPPFVQNNLTRMLMRVAELQEAIVLPGVGVVQRGYAFQPADPASADCPFCVNELGAGITNFMATGGLQYVDNNIDMNFCIARFESEATLAALNSQLASWRDVIFAMFARHLRLSPPDNPGNPDLEFVVDATITRWSGAAAKITYGSTDFAGFVMRLTVKEAAQFTIMA